MKRFLLIYFLMVANILAQGSRPPVTTLSGLTDVFISSPTNGQSLFWNSGTSKWNNGPEPVPTLASLSDVSVSGVTSQQFLRWDSGSSLWTNYGPIAFSDVSGSVAPSQLQSTFGTASNSSYYRGDGAWVSPPVGSIPSTTTLLAGDGGGNAIASLFQPFSGGYQIFFASSSNLPLAVQNNGSSGSASVYIGTDLSSHTLAITSWGQAATPSLAIAQASDSAIISEFGDLVLATNGGVIQGTNNNGTSERWRFGNGLAIGTTIDKGVGTANVSGGYYMNGNKIGGVATVTATVDQTATAETVHVVFTVPANSAVVGTVYHIHASGNTDNGTTSLTFQPKIRWGGTGGVDFMGLNVASFTCSTTASTNRPWVLDARVTIRSIGASGTAMCEYSFTETTTSATRVELAHVANSGATATTIDTTANKDLVLTWTLSVTTGTPHIRTISGNVEVIQP